MKEVVAYLGPAGTFTHAAAEWLFPEKHAVLQPYSTIPDCLQAVADREVQFAVVPVENAIEGSVNSTLDWLIHYIDVPIVAELVYPIAQCLMVHPSQKHRPLREFGKILSHPQAIAQCQRTLRQKAPMAEFVFTDSTAKAAGLIKEQPDQPWMAVGPAKAAEFNGLSILMENMQDHQNNFTRFLAVGWKEKENRQSADFCKTSLQITLPSDYPGALYQVLAAFSWRKINLCRIESRPTKTGLGNYYFIIDAELPVDHLLMQGAISEIEVLGCQVRILGSFPCFYKKSYEKIASKSNFAQND
ncbi:MULTISPECIES: prephenate dehydratase [unclassified Thermoactinomyces]|jgi:prephenate dehydratase|uniref:prephenate dehydratase n=1 Tax=unclassified Thermoactinomyces TaxID=2634588 RepID=UPI0018DE24FB|nr:MULTISPECIES: prephenate dehydratase [unclassified Thermoactinomyces]MBH8596847.1 prephenate dehydratase [Thermoactinomyces sp. CICC 10523]MBH8606772.1 prephenate dehydratase [Thermoactinomyces sp. CICC 10521]